MININSLSEIKDLVVNFKTEDGEIQSVRKVSLDLQKGETLAIVGESGCGKTVLCRSIMRILPSSAYIKSGEILLDNDDISNFGKEDGKDKRALYIYDISKSNDSLEPDHFCRQANCRSN